MKNLFIPYELAVIAKEKGFNEPCIGAYFKPSYTERRLVLSESGEHSLYVPAKNSKFLYAAPLYQQIVDWFDTKGIKIRQSFENNKWTLFAIKNGNDDIIENFTTKDKAIEEAFKLI